MISENIKNARKSKGLTQKELGDKVGVHQSVIAGFETGVKIPSLRAAKNLADVLDVSIDALVK